MSTVIPSSDGDKIESELRAEASAMTDRELHEANFVMLSGIYAKVDAALSEVGPTLAKLQSHPMFKMMFGGK